MPGSGVCGLSRYIANVGTRVRERMNELAMAKITAALADIPNPDEEDPEADPEELRHEILGERGIAWNRRLQMFSMAVKAGAGPARCWLS